MKRLELAKNWMDKYAPEDVKFTVQEEVPKNLKLSSKEKKALHSVVNALKKKDWKQKELFEEFYGGTDGREVSTTMAYVRILTKLLKDKEIGKYIVPIIPDEVGLTVMGVSRMSVLTLTFVSLTMNALSIAFLWFIA